MYTETKIEEVYLLKWKLECVVVGNTVEFNKQASSSNWIQALLKQQQKTERYIRLCHLISRTAVVLVCILVGVFWPMNLCFR